jgi:hypothetical protein
VRLKKFSWRVLQKSPTSRALLDGLLHGQGFKLDA